MNNIGNQFIIYDQPRVEQKKIEKPTAASLSEVWEKEATNMLKFYKGTDAKFAPITDEKTVATSKETASKAAEQPLLKEGNTIPQNRADALLEQRNGKILTKEHILKPDHHPFLRKESVKTTDKTGVEIPGAPNYRNVNGVRGTGLPTIEGIRGVLDEAGAKEKKTRWVNLREEPVIYIDGKPHSLRLKNSPIKNLVNDKTNAKDIEAQERELKKEILEEAKRNGGKLLIHDEDEKGNIITKEIKITPESLKTTDEVFKELKKEGYKVEYNRVPITDERPPEKKDFDALTKLLKDDDPDMPVILNCHAGKGRTTTGMVIADLLNHAKRDKFNKSIIRNKSVRKEILEQGDKVESKEKAGELRQILTLIKTLEEFTKGDTRRSPEEVDRAIDELTAILQDKEPGKIITPGESKIKADEAIDRTGHVQNLREASLKELAKVRYGSSEEKEKSMNYLKRYFLLVSYQEYLKDEGQNGFKKPFSEWLDKNKEFQGIFDKVNFMLALGPSGGMKDTAFA